MLVFFNLLYIGTPTPPAEPITTSELYRQEVILAESSPNAGDGCGLVSDGMYVVAVYVEDMNGTLALQWTNKFLNGIFFGENF